MSIQPLSDAEKLFWVQLIQSENIGPRTFFDLINHFGSAERALEAAPELSHKGGAKRIIKICPQDKAEKWIDRLTDYGGRLLAFGDPDYPTSLAHIGPPPPLLCVKGNIELANKPVVSIVGSRNASAIGLKLARQFARDLGMAGMSICSGLARGIDTAAHEASLFAGTIAVLAGGIDHIYPPENGKLHHDIAEQGLLISEMMPGTVPQAKNFPRRNRLVSGLALGVIVVEAAKRSGSLITARLAAEQGRDVFAVPGSPLDPRAGGTNHLIQNGAGLALRSEEIIAALSPLIESGFNDKEGIYNTSESPENGTTTSSSKADQVSTTCRERLHSLLSSVPIEINDLMRESGEPPAHIHLILLELELAGRLERHTGNKVSLC